MKKIIMLLTLIYLAGCDNNYKAINYPVLPPELKDCKFFKLENTNGANISVARCPNSTTSTTYRADNTYRSGNTYHTAVIIDGVEYVAKPKDITGGNHE